MRSITHLDTCMTHVDWEATMAGVECPPIRWWNGTVGSCCECREGEFKKGWFRFQGYVMSGFVSRYVSDFVYS